MRTRFAFEGVQYVFEHPPGDHIGRCQERSGGFYEGSLLNHIRAVLDRPGIVVDVGAHVGNHTVFFSAVMRRQVIALEPNPLVFPLLARNVAGNAQAAQRVTLIEVAAGSSIGLGAIAPGCPAENTGMQRVDVSVAGCTLVLPLDSVLPRGAAVALMKLDVEGCEPLALAGALDTIRTQRPLIAMEAADNDALAAQTVVLQPLGYRRSRDHWGSTPVYLWSP